MSSKKKVTARQYRWKGCKWWGLNILWGLFPLGLAYILSYNSDGNIGDKTIYNMIHKEGFLLFVCCGLMGAVMVDYVIGGHKIHGLIAFLVYATPFSLIIILVIQYVFTHEEVTRDRLFDIQSFGTIARLVISTVYCILAKGHLYSLEELKERKALGILPKQATQH